VPEDALSAKVMLTGKITRKVNLKGIAVTQGAKVAIEALGGSVAFAEEARKPAGKKPRKNTDTEQG
jgi:large subunit ribosomal protein L15